MKKEIISVITVLSIAFLLTSCESNKVETSNSEDTNTAIVTEAPKEKQTEKPVETTEAKKDISDIVKEIENGFGDPEHFQVSAQSDGKSIFIFEYANNFNNFMQRCTVGKYYSFDAWELWFDKKNLIKDFTESYARIYPEYDITYYILNDKTSSLPVNDSFDYLASFSDGYCLYDYSEQ